VLEAQAAELAGVLAHSTEAAALALCILEVGTPAEVLLCKSSMICGLDLVANTCDAHSLEPRLGCGLAFVDTNGEMEAVITSFGAVSAVDAAEPVHSDGADVVPEK
jgi:hypothetical protein